MKRLTLVWLLIGACLFTGCRSENALLESSFSSREYSFSDDSTHTYNDSNSDIRLEPFDFSCSINVFRNNSGGNLVPCGYCFDVPDNNYLSLTVSTKVSPDKSMDSNNVPMRIYVFGNGVPLEFSLPNYSYGSEFSKVHELAVKKDEEIIFDICIDLDIGEKINMLSILCDFFPEDIPQKGLGAYSGCIVYSLVNSEIKQKPHIETTQGSYINSKEKEFGMDIGKNSLSESNSVITEHHFYDDVIVSDEKDRIYIKFNSGSKTDVPFYITLFCDGKLIVPFDGCYSCGVDCASGQKSFQYQIPIEYFETDGLHTFRAVALPAFGRISGGEVEMPDHSTNKIRIQVSKGD